jgi:lysophospholipase L1-like esterase
MLSSHSAFRLSAYALGAMALAALPAAAQTVRIVVVGDSNVAGRGVAGSESYPGQLEAALRARGLDVSVSNQGVNGEVSAGSAARAAGVSGTDVLVYWNACQNDRRQGLSVEACRGNNGGAMAALKGKGILAYLIRPPVHDINMHQNPSLTLGGQGRTIDYRDGRGAVPDGHFSAAGYSVIVQRSLPAIQKLVVEARKKKA